MPEIRTDCRTVRYESARDSLQALEDRRHDLRRLQRELATLFWHVARTRAFIDERAASLDEWAVRIGYSRSEARHYAALGRAIAAHPPIWKDVEAGDVAPEAAAAIAPLLDDPRLAAEREAWVMAARTKPLRALRTAVRARLECMRQNDLVVTVMLHVTEETRQRFARARVIASNKVGRGLSDGETLTYVTDDFLARHDPLEKTPRARRVGPTADLPHSRYIPTSVQRFVRLRAAETCEFPDCSHTLGLEFSHKRAHVEGSAREPEDLFLFCRLHHVLYDAGSYEIVRDDDEQLAFRVHGSYVVSQRRERDPPPWVRARPGSVESVCLPEAVLM